ncbi:MAG TPA: quinone-dependent dihydroorotate dehydrogenase [Lacibacter sp.]|nr:quinone-dependent dihydroorotate dehydrogenase [Lacibacter sp.]HMO87961.1 quinone-dependent dihydroorotate dehydrogenase [Lacibacter sp.]HMP86078.1 quinone-dependent dihydroorotate dehydrogenase [Lacibacter sp.]
MYQLLRFLFFRLDAEKAHYLAMNGFRWMTQVPALRLMLKKIFTPPAVAPVNVWGLSFKNPIGLGAGFDKNASYLRELELLGFGFVEIGTVTPLPQAGNDKPRLFRLPQDRALINRMGFNNDGVEVIARRLADWRSSPTGKISRMVIGGNIGKNKITPNEEAWKDYEKCFLALYPHVDYFVVNVSSPNTPGLRELQEKEALRTILTHLQTLRSREAVQKPILLKIAPDLSDEQLNDVADLAMEIQLNGLVATNTTIARSGLQTEKTTVEAIGPGGLSGQPLRARSTEVIARLREQTNGALPIMGSGGIFTAADATEKLEAGAVLVQVWTGFIYEGPAIVKKIVQGLSIPSNQ